MPKSDIFLLPSRTGKSIIKEQPAIEASNLLTNDIAAKAVPPVAIKSSIINTLSFEFNASECISIVAFPYSSS